MHDFRNLRRVQSEPEIVTLRSLWARYGATLTWPMPEWYRRALLRDPCVYCGGIAMMLDHIEPRCHKGPNGWENRAPSCIRCESEKNSTGLLFFLVRKHRTGLRPPTTGEQHRIDTWNTKHRKRLFNGKERWDV
jgi:hypothetical protein